MNLVLDPAKDLEEDHLQPTIDFDEQSTINQASCKHSHNLQVTVINTLCLLKNEIRSSTQLVCV